MLKKGKKLKDKFKATVSEDISEGNYPIKITGISKNGIQQTKEFLVEVNSEANAEISTMRCVPLAH